MKAFKLSALQLFVISAFVGLTPAARSELVLTYDFTLNQAVPDNGQYADVRTLGGLSNFTLVGARLNLSNAGGVNNPMWLGDMFSSLTFGIANDPNRTAVLLNRPGVTNTNPFGSASSSFNATFDDSALHTNAFNYAGTGTYNSDGRLNQNPYAPGAYDVTGADRNATLTNLQGNALASGKFTLLVADTQQGGAATLTSWGMTLTGTGDPSATGTMTAAPNGTLSISASGTNTVGAALDTNQLGGGALSVNISSGTTTFTGGISGTSGLNKSGGGALALGGTISYIGPTNVNGGQLYINGNGTSATGAVTVANGAKLGGIGTIGGAVTINPGGVITGATDTTIGTLHLTNPGGLIIAGIYSVDLGGTLSDLLAITGNLDLSSAADSIVFNVLSPLTGTSYILATYTGNLISTFDTGTAPAGYDLVYDTADKMILLNQVTAVPEPSTWLAGALIAGSLVISQRRRFRSARS